MTNTYTRQYVRYLVSRADRDRIAKSQYYGVQVVNRYAADIEHKVAKKENKDYLADLCERC